MTRRALASAAVALALAAPTLVSPRWPFPFGPRCLPGDTSQAIADMSEARRIHVVWADYLHDHPEFDSSQVGNEAWHRLWVGRYDNTLLGLEKARSHDRICVPWPPAAALDPPLGP